MKYNYYVKAFRYEGKLYKAYGKTPEEALKKRVALEIRLKNEDVRKSPLTVEKWLKTALNAYKANVSPEYLYQMELRINKHIISEIGDMRVQDVTPLMCQKVLNNQSGMSTSHIKKVRQEMFFIFDSARKNGLIKTNPAADIVSPQGEKGKRRALTQEERKHFLKVTENPRYILFRLMLFCGCRSSEAMNATYEDIVEKSGIELLHIRGTKTENADRFVPFPEEVKNYLGNKSGYIALTKAGTKFNKSSYRRLTESLKREINLSMGAETYRNKLITFPLAEDFVPYYLRHTYCTDLKKRGIDLRYAKYLMGHSDIRITANIYDHADDESIIEAARQYLASDLASERPYTALKP